MGPVVRADDAHARRQRGRELGQLCLDPVDHCQCVGADPHHHDSADCLSLAVPLGDAGPEIRADRHLRHIADPDRPSTAS
jgi:hypothetical protein